jgi:hypothetical protein
MRLVLNAALFLLSNAVQKQGKLSRNSGPAPVFKFELASCGKPHCPYGTT